MQDAMDGGRIATVLTEERPEYHYVSSVTVPLTQTTVRKAALMALAFGAAATAPLVGGKLPGPHIEAFMSFVAGVGIVVNLLAGYVFIGQYLRHGAPRLCWLGIAYFSSGLLALPCLLFFPHIVPFANLFGSNAQTSMYLWIEYHALFPAFAIVAMLRPAVKRRPIVRLRGVAVGCLIGGVATLTVGSTLLILRLGATLPKLVIDGTYTTPTHEFVTPLLVALNVIALAAIAFSRPYSHTSAWLAVALFASALEILLGFSFPRFAYGWYAARTIGMLSSGIVLVAYLREMLNLQFKLARACDELSRFEILAENGPDSMVFVDRRTLMVMHVNTTATKVFGYSKSEFRNLSLRDFRDPADKRYLPLKFDSGDHTETTEINGIRKDGSTFPGELTARVSVIEGVEVILCVLRDITERQRSQELVNQALAEALTASQLKSEFVATMSHEIRTPMNGVIGMTEIMLDSPLDAEQRECAETIRDSAHALLRIINDVLDFSKIEAGKMEIETIDFSVGSIVESVVMLLRGAAQGLTLSTFVAPDIPPTLRGDPGRLRQVLFNIVGNAVKFTKAGSVSVSATCESAAGGRVIVRFEVRDTGIGMTDGQRAALFQPFVQADGSTTRRFGGTGLGLSIARRLVELMGGTIDVQSEPGVGTTFSFTTTFHDGSEVEVDAAPTLEHIRLLVVDEDPAVRAALHAYAEAWNLEWSDARDAAEALTAFRDARTAGLHFDVAIIAQTLPDMSGFELGRAIKTDPAFASAELLMLTPFEEAGRFRAAPASEFSDVVMKPIVQSQIYNAILNATHRPETFVEISPRVVAGTPCFEARLPASRTPESAGRVLVVEDNEINRRVAARQLKLLGYDFEMAVDGDDALQKVHAETFDVILMDCNMPGKDGFETTALIRTSPSCTVQKIPIVAMTAGALDRDRQRCLDAGMDEYVSKPVKLADLRDMLAKTLRHQGVAEQTPLAG